MTSFYKLTTLQTFLLSLFVTVFSAANVSGQTPVANLTCGYSYGNTPSPSWVSILNGTGTTVVATGTGIDDQNYMGNAFPAGFTFDFNGTVYNSFNISANGFIFFGSTDPGAINNPIANASTAYSGAIAALGGNIQAHTSSSTTPQILVQYEGTAPNRIATIEWVSFKPQNNSGGFCSWLGGNWNKYDFQIKLYENGGSTSNVIDIIHKDQNPVCINSNGLNFQVGLRGATNADYRTRSGSGLTNNSNTSEGSSNSATISHGSENYFSSNTRFRYTPKIQPAAVSGSAEICLGEGGTTLAEANNGAITGATYQWYSSPANTPIAGATNASYPINPGLGATSYYVVVSNTDGCVRVSQPFTVTVTDCGNPSIVVTATAGSGGSISPSGTTTYSSGATPTYTFTPDCGYEVSTVTVGGSSVPLGLSYTFPPLTVSSTIHVTFSLKIEICNGIDDDCDGTIDNVAGLAECQVCQNGQLITLSNQTWYQDADGDGYGDSSVSISACVQPNGYVSDNTDCDDTDNEVTNVCFIIITSSAGNGGTISPLGDTSVDEGDSQQYTITPNCGYEIVAVLVNGNSVGVVSSYTFANVQSNQTISVTFSLKAEVCNGIDDDCDGTIDNVPNLSDCEICQNGQLVQQPVTTWYADEDGDGHGDINNSITDCIQPDGFVTSNNDCNDEDPLIWLAKPAEISLNLSPNNVCTVDAPFALGNVLPTTGQWSGNGVQNGVFSPAVAGVGSHTLTYFVAGDGQCVLPASASATMTVALCSGIDEESGNGVIVYPTQTTGKLIVAGQSLVSARMMDMNGRLIETISLLGHNELDITSYASGIYLLGIDTQTRTTVHKVIKVD